MNFVQQNGKRKLIRLAKTKKIIKISGENRGISQIIRARVAIKSDIHQIFNYLGPTTMFTLDLIDESGEIRVSAYGETANKLYPLVEVIN